MNLLSLLKYQLGSNIAEQMGNFLGEDAQKTKSAIDATFPALMSVFVKRASNSTGANDLMDTIKLGNHDGSMLNYVSGLFSGGSSMNSILSSGNVLANKFLGDKKSVLSQSVADYSGISSHSADTLVRVGMPLVMGIIGKQVKNQNLDTDGLMKMLSAQKGHIGAAIPSGFAINTKGKSRIIKNVTPTPSVKPPKPKYEAPKRDYNRIQEERDKTALNVNKPYTPEPKKAYVPPTTKPTYTPPVPPKEPIIKEEKVVVEAPKVTPTPVVETKRSGFNFKKLLPILLIGALVLLTLLVLGIRGCSSEEGEIKKKNNKEIVENPTIDNTSTSDVATTTPTEDEKVNQKPEETVVVEDNSSSSTDSSTNDYDSGITTPRGEIKQQLSQASAGTSISLDGLHFRGTSSIIRGSSRHIIREVAEVMKSNPSMQLHVSSSPINHAVAFKKGLMDLGIDRNRIQHIQGGNATVQLEVK